MKNKFVHLHLHTEYSLLDGVIKINSLMEKAKSLGMDAVAITDHGNLFGAISFYKTAINYGIKPILGCEFYVAPRSLKDKVPNIDSELSHITILAKNYEGYKNLIKMSSIAYLEGFYYKPRIDKDLLKDHKEGLIVLSGCKNGEIPLYILSGELEKAKNTAYWYLEQFGEDNFFIEIQDNQLPEQKIINSGLKKISEELSIPLVITNDVHYLEKEDSLVQDIMMCIQTKKTLEDADRLSFGSDQFYFKSYEEIFEIGKNFPSSIENTVLISDMCNVEIELNKVHIPTFNVPSNETPTTYFKKLALEGISKRYPILNKNIENRLSQELKIIEDFGFEPYFLIVWDLINYARSKGILVGPGRGSVAGSIVAYALEITQVDPIKYGLVFERFLNPERINFPDFDLDFCHEKRGEIINYLVSKYGTDRVAQIVTFTKEQAKLAIRDVGRVLNIPLKEVDRIAKMIPYFGASDDESISNIEKAIESVIELKNLYENNESIRKLLEISKKIEGLTKNVSVHAAGIVISDTKLVDRVPIFKSGEDGVIMTQFADNDLEALGLLKTDILGLNNLDVIAKTIENIKKLRKIDLSLENIPLNDSKTYKLFSEGKTDGIFQFESIGMKNLLIRLKPTNIEDLIALNALHRPGPIGTGMVEDFIKRKKGEVKITYLHEKLEPILRETYGIIVYQEQVMKIANIIAGYSLGQADILRRAMAKKEKTIMAKQRKVFLEGAKKQGIKDKLANEIFELISHFAGYGFNKSHSAAYGLLAYKMAFLKANYPLEFMTALLSTFFDNKEKITKYIEECKSLSIPIYPPDINKSHYDFSISGLGIRFGLSAIKNVGKGAIEEIIKARQKVGEFKTIFDLAQNINPQIINAKVLESLILSGACDCLEGNKAQKLALISTALEIAKKSHLDRESGQTSLFSINSKFSAHDAYQPLPEVQELSNEEITKYEKELLGIYISHHPLECVKEWFQNNNVINICDLKEYVQAGIIKDSDMVRIGGIISDIKDYLTKDDQKMKFIQIEDTTGKIDVVAFSPILKRFEKFLYTSNIVIIIGKISVFEKEINGNENKTELRIRCEDIIQFKEISDSKKKPKRINIKLTPKENIKEILTDIKEVLLNNVGESKVVFHVPYERKKILIDNLKVSTDVSTINELQNIIGHNEDVWIEEI